MSSSRKGKRKHHRHKKKSPSIPIKAASTTGTLLTALSAGGAGAAGTFAAIKYSAFTYQQTQLLIETMKLFISSNHTIPIMVSIPGLGNHAVNITVSLQDQIPNLIDTFATLNNTIPSYASWLIGGIIGGATAGTFATFALFAVTIGLLYDRHAQTLRVDNVEETQSLGYQLLQESDDSDEENKHGTFVRIN